MSASLCECGQQYVRLALALTHVRLALALTYVCLALALTCAADLRCNGTHAGT